MRTTTSPTRSSRPSRLPSLKVLGIDPGLAATGYAVITPSPGRAVVVDTPVIGTASALPLEPRLSTISDVADRLLVSHAPSPPALARALTAGRSRPARVPGHPTGWRASRTPRGMRRAMRDGAGAQLGQATYRVALGARPPLQ